jgi:hypothetical protein
MIIEGKNEIRLRCDRCGAQMILAANAEQASRRRRPSGWLSESQGRDTCPLCARTLMDSFRPGANRY